MNKSTFLVLLFTVFIIGGYLYYKEGTLPMDKADKSSKIFIVKSGEPLSTVAKNLSNDGLIRNKIIFYFVTKQLGIDKEVQAGDFRLSPSMDVYQIAKALTHGTKDIWVTLIEGTRKEEMAQVIAQNMDIPETEFIKEATEGYLFPDTYLLPRDATVGAIIKILKNNFDQKFSANLKQKAAALGLSPREVIILASLVEKEARASQDRPEVAGILLKRLKAGWPLQIDATVQYALGYQPNEKTWWKKDLTTDDLKIDSPYNTYINDGLPPGPICNPGLASIDAVINANVNTPYWYYISDKSGRMHYAVTLEQQNTNAKKYLQ